MVDNRVENGIFDKARSSNKFLVENDALVNRATAYVIPWIIVTVPLVIALKYLNIFKMPYSQVILFSIIVTCVVISSVIVNRISNDIVFNKYFNVMALSLGVFSVALLPNIGIWLSFLLSIIVALFYIDPKLTVITSIVNYVLMLIAMWFRVSAWMETGNLLADHGKDFFSLYMGYVLGLTVEYVVAAPILYFISKTEEEHIIREDDLMEEVKSDEERYALAFENSNDIIYDYNFLTDEFVAFGSLEEHDSGSAAGKRVYNDFVTTVLNPGKMIYPSDVDKIRFFMDGKLTGPIEFRYHKNEDEDFRWYSLEGQIVYDENTGESLRGVGRIKDITDEKREEQNLLERVERDRNTNFIKWDVGLRLLSQKTGDESKGTAAHICYIHINNLKNISESQGGVFLDAVIERIAENIRNLTTESDLKIRISDSSFAIYFDDPSDEVLEVFDSKIREALNSIVINREDTGCLEYNITYFHGLTDLMDTMPMEEKFQIEGSGDRQKDNRYYGEMIPFVFNVLQRSKELQSAVDMTLNRISNQFDIDYIHILERDSTTTLESLSCIGEFDRAPRLLCPFIGRKFNVDKADYEKIRDLLGNGNYFLINKEFFENIPGDTADFLEALGTSGLVCVIRSEDVIRGCIFYEKNDRDYEWPQELIDVLSEMSSIIASFILKNMADKASAAKSNFLSSMSHEIRTPMNAIAGFSELILSEKNISDRTKKYAGNIRSSANNLLGIINQILDFSKIESGKFEIIEDNYAMSSLLNDITSVIGVQVSEKPIKFIVNIGDHIPEGLRGDVLRIRQIFINILNNSIKYTDRGEIELTVDWRYKDDSKGELIASVRDTGIGIKEEDMPKLFESFMQIDTRRNRGITGTGLGLAVCKNLLNLMDGNIEVESKYGEGSTFTFTIPQTVVDSAECTYVYGEAVTSQDTFALSFVCPGARILVVDDNRVNLEVAKGLISQYGAEVELASSGGEAIARIEDEPRYDIVFMDHMMPGMDGIETTVQIRKLMESSGDALREKYGTTIIALTANAIKGMEEEFLNAGMNDYLTKPIELRRLEEILRKWIPEEKLDTSPEGIKAVSDKVNGDGQPGPSFDGDLPSWAGDLEHINVKAGLVNALGDIEMYKTLLSSFISSNKPETIDSQFESGDLKAYQISVHALKSSARYIGAIPLSDAAKLQEDLAKEGLEEEIRLKKPELDELLSKVLNEAASALSAARKAEETEEEETGDDKESISTEDALSKMDEILDLLTEMESDEAENSIQELLSEKGFSKDVRDLLKAALKNIRNFDYDEAVESIDSAKESLK